MQRIYWWRFFFDVFAIKYIRDDNRNIIKEHPYLVFVARLIVPCAGNYRPPKPCNDNKFEFNPWPWL